MNFQTTYSSGQIQMTDTYNWLPTACAPRAFPAESFRADFIFEDGSRLYIPANRVLTNGWGNPGAVHIVGEDLKPIPRQLAVTWLSFAERKFYTGTFNLPHRKIEQLFKQGYINRMGESGTYTKINLGLAPGGTVMLWMLGAGWSTEIAHFQANTTQLTMHEFMPDSELSLDGYMDAIIRTRKEKVQTDDIPVELWRTHYRTLYNWRPQFRFEDTGNLTGILAEFFNGNKYFTTPNNPTHTQYRERAIPKYFRINWIDKNLYKYGAHIHFDEVEIFGAFRQLFQQNKASKAQLHIQIDKYNTTWGVSPKTNGAQPYHVKCKYLTYIPELPFGGMTLLCPVITPPKYAA